MGCLVICDTVDNLPHAVQLGHLEFDKQFTIHRLGQRLLGSSVGSTDGVAVAAGAGVAVDARLAGPTVGVGLATWIKTIGVDGEFGALPWAAAGATTGIDVAVANATGDGVGTMPI